MDSDYAVAGNHLNRLGWVEDGSTKQDDRGTFTLNEVRYRLSLDNM